LIPAASLRGFKRIERFIFYFYQIQYAEGALLYHS
jgi:hypothetical protein